jgi:hypothetical protein
MRGAYLEVMGDMLASVAVIGAAALIAVTGFVAADAIASALIAVLILPRTWSLLREAVEVLLEATPKGVDLDEVRRHIRRAPGVLDVYAPAKAGPWPVVVMLNGYGGEKGGLSEHARKVSDLGFVVFSADWGVGLPETALTYEQLLATLPQVACAVADALAQERAEVWRLGIDGIRPS